MKKFNNWNSNRSQHNRRQQSYHRPSGKFDPRTDTSYELLDSFTFRTVKAEPGEDADRLIRRFKRVVEASGVLSEIKKREHFKSNGQKKRERQMKSIKNARKRKAKLDKMDFDSKKINTRPNPQRRPAQSESQTQ
jgi:small subunit ribosomal protein S21